MSFVELVEAIAKRTKMPKAKVRRLLQAFVLETSETLKTGERVVLPGFGVFFSQEIKPGDLFGGTRKSEGGKKIRFRQSRRK